MSPWYLLLFDDVELNRMENIQWLSCLFSFSDYCCFASVSSPAAAGGGRSTVAGSKVIDEKENSKPWIYFVSYTHLLQQ